MSAAPVDVNFSVPCTVGKKYGRPRDRIELLSG